jgi:hypothetical protein
MPPFALGASGKSYPGSTFRGGSSSSDGQWMVYDTTWCFPGLEEQPTKLVWELLEKTRPEKLFSFRMVDIPLPQAGPFIPRRNPGPRPPATGPQGPKHPHYEEGGGVLVSSIEVAGKPAPAGSLQLGLAAQSGPDWGPVRWTDVEVTAAGVARLEDVKPGRYRLLRVYRPKDRAAAPPGEGRWLNGEVVVEVVAGKETALAALQWKVQSRKPATAAPAKAAPRKPASGGR